MLFITRKNREQDMVGALDAGADDYMIKLVQPSKMLTRINALLRRREPPDGGVLHLVAL